MFLYYLPSYPSSFAFSTIFKAKTACFNDVIEERKHPMACLTDVFVEVQVLVPQSNQGCIYSVLKLFYLYDRKGNKNERNTKFI